MLLKKIRNEGAKKLNVAVIGGGISGLGAAYALAPHHNITIYEARTRLGGHARTLICGREEQFPVDTGFMVFNYRNYPKLNALFGELDISVKPTNMSFAVSLDDGKFEYGLHQPRRLLADPWNAVRPRFWKMLSDILKFNKSGHAFKNDPEMTIGDVILKLGLSDEFSDRYLGPLAGAIWSTSSEDMLKFPAQSLIRFFDNHGLMSATDSPKWFTVDGGSKTYVDRMHTALLNKGCVIKTKSTVESVKRDKEKVEVSVSSEPPARYDHVIFACHSNQALQIISNPSVAEIGILSAIRYKKNNVILHDDISQMPQRKACWSSWVYKGRTQDRSNNSFTYWMNSLQGIPNTSPVFVTLNPQTAIKDENIYDQTSLAHPQFDLPALRAQEKLPTLQGQNRSWFCGAYTRYGFHEDGFASGLEIASAIHEMASSQ